MRFNARKFKKNAKQLRRLIPESHLKELDGKEVVGGKIEYMADGEEFYLYPVLPEWCEGD